jgi:large subunit ribosomal protein L21
MVYTFVTSHGRCGDFFCSDGLGLYAVVRSGGKQYRVEEGAELTVGKLAGKAGDSVTLSEILFVADGEAIKAGPAALKGARVTAEIVGHAKGPKIDVLRYKNKTRQRKNRGHRQDETTIRIMKIEGLR